MLDIAIVLTGTDSPLVEIPGDTRRVALRTGKSDARISIP